MKDYSLNEEARCTSEFTCRSCGDHVSGYAAIDPVEIDEYFFCETCANNYVALRIDGYLDKVSDKTNKLVWDGYYDVYDAINFPK